jgi:hypothetical protein
MITFTRITRIMPMCGYSATAGTGFDQSPR